MDPLSAFFLITIACVSVPAGIYGTAYLRGHRGHHFFYLALVASMAAVVLARDAVVFLVAWELMTVFAYFLVTFDDEQKTVRQAGFLYLVLSHCGTFCLLAMFLLLGRAAGSLDFGRMALVSYAPVLAGACFALGLVGFGVKAGFVPLHVWLPYAHPAAPSHVSAVLSGLVIKTGIYGILRLILILKILPAWCGPVVLLVGAVSGVLGVLYALGQHEIKRLLAYHSIENIGIIALGMGMGLVGTAHHQSTIAVIGYAGALLHTLNHAVFKGLLFLSAGSVIRQTGTGEIDRMGGLLKALPLTGHFFLVGALSICAMPLFSGFISEWLVYRALFEGAVHLDKQGVLLSLLSLIALALIGGLAAACFAKAFGAIFLGQNRSHEAKTYRESPFLMWGPMAFLAAVCVWIGLFPKTMVLLALDCARFIAGVPADTGRLLEPVIAVSRVFYVFLLILGPLALYRSFLARHSPERRAETWACGYAHPSPRMQYTASSFAAPLLLFFKAAAGYYVQSGRSKTVDASEHFLFRPFYVLIKKSSRAVLKLQSGHIPQYLLYILLALVALLLWKFPWV